MFIVLAAVFGTVVYRMSVVVALYSTSSHTFSHNYATYITSVTAAFLNLFVILLLERVRFRPEETNQVVTRSLENFGVVEMVACCRFITRLPNG